jgi:hypothetical protein
MTLHNNVDKRVLDYKSHWTEVYLDEVNVQIDWKKVKAGDVIQITMKCELRPPGSRSSRKRLIAPYVQTVVVEPSKCCCSHDWDTCPIDNEKGDYHGITICPKCIETWCWDWFMRNESDFQHGTNRAYDAYGCRCPLCRGRNKSARIERMVQKV